MSDINGISSGIFPSGISRSFDSHSAMTKDGVPDTIFSDARSFPVESLSGDKAARTDMLARQAFTAEFVEADEILQEDSAPRLTPPLIKPHRSLNHAFMEGILTVGDQLKLASNVVSRVNLELAIELNNMKNANSNQQAKELMAMLEKMTQMGEEIGAKDEELTALKAQVQALLVELDDLTAQLAQMEEEGILPDDPAFLALTRKIADKQVNVNALQATVTRTEAELDSRIAGLEQALAQYKELNDKFVKESSNSAGLKVYGLESADLLEQKQATYLQKLNELLGQMIVKVNESSLKRMKAMADLNEKMSDETRKSIREKGEQAAKMSNSCMGQLMKVLSPIIQHISWIAPLIVGALGAMSGGTLVPLLAPLIGALIAGVMMIPDVQNGLAEKMGPALMDLFSGIGNEDLKMALMLLLQVVVVAAAMFAGPALSALGSSMKSTTAGAAVSAVITASLKTAMTAVTRLIPEILKKGAEAVAKFITMLGQKLAEFAPKIAEKSMQRLNLSVVALQTALGATDASLRTVEGVKRFEKALLEIDIDMLMRNEEIIKSTIKLEDKLYQDNHKFAQSLTDTLLNLAQTNQQTANRTFAVRTA